MSDIAIRVENLGKLYRLGVIGTGTLSHDLNRWWATVRGKEDPYSKIGQTNDRTVKGESDFVWSLKDVNFEVKKGEVLGIIGRNGAGKSTLLKILSKVTLPTTGKVKIDGRIASLLEVGTGFHPEMTGRENIFLNGAILGMTKREINAKLEEIIDFSGVMRYIDTPVKRYSSGMYVRLAFAVAAFLEPEILIVDEVLAVGDAEFQKKCLGRMQEVSTKDGRTVLFVSHNMASMRQLCKRGLMLQNGEVFFSGSMDDSIEHYFAVNETEAYDLGSRIDYGVNFLKINSLTINESTERELYIHSSQRALRFQVTGELSIETTMSIDVFIYDTHRVPLAYFNLSYREGVVPNFKPGEFQFDFLIDLPQNLNKGKYPVEVRLTQPDVRPLATIKEAVVLNSEGSPTTTGRVVDYKEQKGFLLLK